jgi:hypothetical protein
MIKAPSRRSLTLAAALSTQLLTGAAFATLIPIGAVPTTGAGLGAVNTLVTFQNTGTEVGAVGLLPGGGGTEVTGSTVAFGVTGFPSASGVTNETGGNAGSNLYTASSLGLVSGTSTTFSNVVLLFNGTELQSPAGEPITLTDLSLNLFSPTGTLLGSFSTAGGFSYSAIFQGVGSAGYGFQLDTLQAGQANTLLAANPNLVIGAAARATGADAGPETVSIATLAGGGDRPPTGVPDAGTSVALLGLGLLCLAGLNRKFRR